MLSLKKSPRSSPKGSGRKAQESELNSPTMSPMFKTQKTQMLSINVPVTFADLDQRGSLRQTGHLGEIEEVES